MLKLEKKIDLSVNKSEFVKWAMDENGIGIDVVQDLLISDGKFSLETLLSLTNYIPSYMIINKEDVPSNLREIPYGDDFEVNPNLFKIIFIK